MKEINADIRGPINCRYSRIPTYKKNINIFREIACKPGGKKRLLDEINTIDQFKIAGVAENFEEQYQYIDKDLGNVSKQFTRPTDYLNQLKNHVPSEIISSENYQEIQSLANVFTNNITSFFGFETELHTKQSRSDYLLAVSSQNEERENLLTQLQENQHHQFSIKEWKNIKDLVSSWNNPDSMIYKNVLGLWLEFDTSQPEINQIPSVFLHTTNLRIKKPEDVKKCLWVTREAIPLLSGNHVPKDIENKFIESLEKLPEDASVFHVASMLSRKSTGLRVVVKRIRPEEIVPYLKSLGWTDTNNGLATLIDEIKELSSTIRLHINISSKIDEQIGLECFIKPDKYHQVTGWDSFFDYLVQKGICKPELSQAILNFPGVEIEDQTQKFSFQDFQPSVKMNDSAFSKALVRYISHVKIVYLPDKDLKAKAYTGVRMFSMNQ